MAAEGLLERVAHTEDNILRAIKAGHRALLVTGNVHDFYLIGEEIAYRPQLLADQLVQQGYTIVRYSKSQGGRIHNYSSLSPHAKQELDSRLNAVGLLPLLHREGQNNPEEVRHFFRAAARLLQMPFNGHPYTVIVDYTEHLAPAVQSSAAAADEQTFVSEVLHMLANAPAMRKSGNLLICFVRDGLQNILLNDLHRLELPFPTEAQMEVGVRLLLTRRNAEGKPHYGALAESFTEQEFARLTRGLRLRDVEAMLREARAEQIPLQRDRVLAAKAAAILRVSEGTLSVMSGSLTLDDIVGLEVVKRSFLHIAARLKAGDPTSPRAVLMTGPPGTAKSTFAPLLGALSGFNVLQFRNVKNMYVGESERRLNLALSLAESLAPTILFIDEITETAPNRNANANNDGGVSLDLLAQLFQFSARDDLRGRVMLLAASNVPERLDPAWHDRFVVMPFLELLPREICTLFGVLQRRATGQSTLDPSDPAIVEAAQLLHRKGASPRKVLDIVNHALLFSSGSTLGSDDILAAARDYVGSANPMTVAYTSLVAISLTSFQSYLPWSLHPQSYVYPWYLDDLVEKTTGILDRQKLQMRIQEYRKATNL